MGLLEENKYDWPKIPAFDLFLLLVHQGTFKQNSPWHLQSKTFQTPYICSEHPSFSYEAAWVAASSPQTLEHDPSRGITPSTLGESLGTCFPNMWPLDPHFRVFIIHLSRYWGVDINPEGFAENQVFANRIHRVARQFVQIRSRQWTKNRADAQSMTESQSSNNRCNDEVEGLIPVDSGFLRDCSSWKAWERWSRFGISWGRASICQKKTRAPSETDPWQQHWSSLEPNSEPQDCYQESWASETGKEEARPDKTIKSVYISCTHSRGWEFWHAQWTEDITEDPRLR